MRARARRPVVVAAALPALAAGLLVASGCAGRPGDAPDQGESLVVYVPCPIAGSVRRAVAAYEAAAPGDKITIQVDKPLAILSAAQAERERPAAVITMGPVEMEALVAAGAVSADDVQVFAESRSPLVVVVPAKASPGLASAADLADPRVKKVYVEDGARSSLGVRSERALREAGLWESVAPKIVHPEPDAMVLSELLAGKADAAVVLKDCLLEGAKPGDGAPKTIRLIGELTDGQSAPTQYQAAPLARAPRAAVAREFVNFLASAEGREAFTGRVSEVDGGT